MDPSQSERSYLTFPASSSPPPFTSFRPRVHSRAVAIFFLATLSLFTFYNVPSFFLPHQRVTTYPPLSPLPMPIPFVDVTADCGLGDQKTDAYQFGGANFMDLDSDGYYDLILTYHNKYAFRIYYGSPSGHFIRERNFVYQNDIHGISVARRNAWSNEKVLAIPIGGGGGKNLKEPVICVVNSSRTYTDISHNYGLGGSKARGRVPVFMDLSLRSENESRTNLGGPDLLLVNLLGRSTSLEHHAYQNVQGNYDLQELPNFKNVNEERAIVTDVDNDGVMELVHFSVFTIWKLASPFTFEDVTRKLWRGVARRNMKRSIAAVVELDFDNDGFMDLYLARAESALVTPRGPPSVPEIADILLRNVGGKYQDVSKKARIPTDTNSMAVSAEDFDNDGYVDIIITTFEGPDLILINNADGTFEKINPGSFKPETARGANVMAADYDLDGRVDYIVGHGWRKKYFGNFRLMKSQLVLSPETHYLHVRVGDEETHACTSLNAMVTVYLCDKVNEKLIRRVGGRGAGCGGLSYIDTVHFGLGSATTACRVTVKWTTGAEKEMLDVAAGQMISFGIFHDV